MRPCLKNGEKKKVMISMGVLTYFFELVVIVCFSVLDGLVASAASYDLELLVFQPLPLK